MNMTPVHQTKQIQLTEDLSTTTSSMTTPSTSTITTTANVTVTITTPSRSSISSISSTGSNVLDACDTSSPFSGLLPQHRVPLLGYREVEDWLESNQEWHQDYMLRTMDTAIVNKWLLMHGFNTLQDYIHIRRESLTPLDGLDSSGTTSPDPRGSIAVTDSGFFSDTGFRPHRSNSKKFLRQDFARGRNVGIFRTCESPSRDAATLAERRCSLKGMRQYLSLPPTSVNMLSMLIQSKVRLPSYTSIDEDLKRQLRFVNERDFFLEIVKDISHDLDLKSLTSRILVNLSILLEADRSSLFFVEGKGSKKHLVSKVFDAYTGTHCIPASSGGDNIVKIPWGRGILGHVADTGQTVNITNANKDSRYNTAVDQIVGYTTDSLLCMPCRSSDGEILGVAQVINKNKNNGCFSKDDEKLMDMYLTFCGMAISNAQAIDSYTREYDRNKALLEVVHDLFEEQTSLDNVVTKIMQKAQTLLNCERCLVLLRNNKSFNQNGETKGFSRVFDLYRPCSDGQFKCKCPTCRDLHSDNKLAEIVASTGETVNIGDPTSTMLGTGKRSCGFQVSSVLCKPMRNNDFQIIGVAQLLNKVDNKPFDENDDQLFEAFTIFCGLGINNCQLYDELERSAAKQAVALEVLSYHASVSAPEISMYKNISHSIETCAKLRQIDFNDFALNADDMLSSAIHIFTELGLLRKFNIEYETLVRWLLTVRKNYRNVAYHNWRHAFNVCQFMFALLSTCRMRSVLSDLEIFALVVAALCHDLDHRGTNNAFQHKSDSPLAQLYGTMGTLEHHHFNHAVMILNSPAQNILANLNSSDYTSMMMLLKHAILATDLSQHVTCRKQFYPLVQSGRYSWEDQEQRQLLRSILMTTCDIATITKPWPIQRKAADLVVAEFLDQGDKERDVLKIQPMDMMDREKQGELPRLQLNWIDSICMPLYQALCKLGPEFESLYERVLENRSHWDMLDKQKKSNLICTLKETDV